MNKSKNTEGASITNTMVKEDTVEQKPLNKRVAGIKARLSNVDSIKTAVGLRKVRDAANAIVGELKSAIEKERKSSKEGDDLDVLASADVIAKLEKNSTLIQEMVDQHIKKCVNAMKTERSSST